MNSINNYISQRGIQQSPLAFAVQTANESENLTIHSTLFTEHASTVVTISSEARDKLAEEKSAIGKELTKQIEAKNSEKTEEPKATDIDRLDKIIANILESKGS